jgi:hypothetical protein
VVDGELGQPRPDAPPPVVGVNTDDLDDGHALVEGIEGDSDKPTGRPSSTATKVSRPSFIQAV